MSGFKFPPPPPPPPKASGSSNDAPAYTSSQRGGHNDSRGGRGRGFGGRGGGNNQRGGRGGRGGHQSGSRGSYQQNGSFRGGQQSRGRGGSQHNGPRYQNQQPQQSSPPPSMPANPAGTFVNPPFNNGLHLGAQAQPQADPVAFAQAMAFMATPAGMQAMNAFASQMSNGGVAPQPPPAQMSQSSPRQQHGTKRKWNDRSEPRNDKSQQPQHAPSKPQKAKAAPPPAVPSFGFALPTIPSAKPLATSNKTNQKRKVNLGLTARDKDEVESVPDEELGEEDDEEAALASSMGISGAVFEHDGLKISLQTPAELQAWIRDRRKQFPTRKRIAEKAREVAEQRAKELEFLKKVKGDSGVERKVAQAPPAQKPLKHIERSKEEEGRQRELAQLRQRLHESMLAKNASKEAASAQSTTDGTQSKSIDLGLGYDSETDSDDEDSVLSDSSVVSSDNASAEESSDDSDADSDAAPEEHSSKTAPPPIVQPPPAPLPVQAVEKTPRKNTPKVCHNWEQTGRCKFGRKCRFPHPPKEEPKRRTLYEVMVGKELEERDRETLKAIKWLGQNGYLG
ncbi:hypothetical protein BDV96DRAFT_590721 [Lophiotrema nucula]|uniref:C3H1-type domain-containing protein n=1 Tax=Lophiotrema nucula TaxID=690887 RepID=A0A6A5YKL2_9PLEO|nr:hypothetical protein BDV96DRAFT_590721 [Lophiotrema nucula]